MGTWGLIESCRFVQPAAEEWLLAKVLERLSAFDALPVRVASKGLGFGCHFFFPDFLEDFFWMTFDDLQVLQVVFMCFIDIDDLEYIFGLWIRC